MLPASVWQTSSITSFFTSEPRKTNGGDQRSISSHTESQTNRESKKDATQLDLLIQGLGDDCVAPPLATSTLADIQEAGLSPQSLQASGHHRMGTSFLTVLSLFQSDTLAWAGESQDSLACSFTQDLEVRACWTKERERILPGKGNGFMDLRKRVARVWRDAINHLGARAISPWTRLNWRSCWPKKIGRPLPPCKHTGISGVEKTQKQ